MNYFLINNKDGVYTIADGPRELPIIYKNVSNFNELGNSDPELLKNLSWLGEAELGFWLKDSDDEPSYTWMQKLQESYTINPDQQNVKISFQVVDLTQEEVDLKKNNWLNEIRLIRNRYLQTTDFTQLIDAPFTEEEKNQCRIFRQELRDMFNGEVLVNELSWPSIPSALSLEPFPEIPELI